MKLTVQVTEHPRMARVLIQVEGMWRSLTHWVSSIAEGARELARLRRLDTIDAGEARRLLWVFREAFPRLLVVKSTNFLLPAEWTFQRGSAYGGWFFHQGQAVSTLITSVDDAMEFLARAVHEGTCQEELVEFLVDQVRVGLSTDTPAPDDAYLM